MEVQPFGSDSSDSFEGSRLDDDSSQGETDELRPEGGGGGGGVKVDFPVFTYLIRAAGDEQEEKNRTEI